MTSSTWPQRGTFITHQHLPANTSKRNMLLFVTVYLCLMKNGSVWWRMLVFYFRMLVFNGECCCCLWFALVFCGEYSSVLGCWLKMVTLDGECCWFYGYVWCFKVDTGVYLGLLVHFIRRFGVWIVFFFVCPPPRKCWSLTENVGFVHGTLWWFVENVSIYWGY